MLSNEDINLKQVQAGLAWHYKKYASEQNLEESLRYARR